MDDADAPFTRAELDHLGGRRLGRLATVAPDGTPQNNPVGLRRNPATPTIDISGRSLGTTRTYRNAREYPPVSLVVDDVASLDGQRAGMHGRDVEPPAGARHVPGVA